MSNEEAKQEGGSSQVAAPSNTSPSASPMQSDMTKASKSPGPAPQKALYVFSNIFEKQEDIKNNPFIFEKHNLKKRKTDEEYGEVKMKSMMIRPKKQSALHQQPVQLNEINHDMDDISVEQKNEPAKKTEESKAPNFKQKYMMLVGHRLIQFNSEDDTMERGILNCKYARLKKTHLKDSNQKMWGFILMAKGQCLQFYSTDEQVVKDWIEAFKTTAIFLDLKDEFILGGLLGRGNFAKVHSCTRQSDPEGQKYALKTIEKSGIKKCKRNIQSVLMEIDILRTLKHPFIIKLHEVYESNKYIHLVLCYLDGGELFERIKSRQVYQESIAISVMKNMLQALDFMHKNDVVHRDLKPENLILASKDNDYDLRIADFGLAAFAKPGELLKLRCGSPGYVAPELLDDVGYEQKADVFSAGVILYVLLTGRPAFRGYNINEILIKNKKCEVEYPAKYWDNISDKAKDLVDKMLQKDPKIRISAEDALKHPWFNQDEKEINTKSLGFAKAIDDDEDFAKVDYEKINDADEEEINLVTCTPVLAKRNLNPGVPETPFLSQNKFDRNNATPMMTGGIIIQKAQPPKPVQVGAGITIMRPQGMGGPQNKSKLPEIPQFKGRGRGGPALGGGLGGGLGRGRGRGGIGMGGLGKLGGGLGPMKALAEVVDKPLAEQPLPSKMEDAKEEEKKEEVKEEQKVPEPIVQPEQPKVEEQPVEPPKEEVKVEEPPKPQEEAKPEVIQPVVAQQEEKKEEVKLEEVKLEEPKVEVIPEKEEQKQPIAPEEVQAKVNIPGFKQVFDPNIGVKPPSVQIKKEEIKSPAVVLQKEEVKQDAQPAPVEQVPEVVPAVAIQAPAFQQLPPKEALQNVVPEFELNPLINPQAKQQLQAFVEQILGKIENNNKSMLQVQQKNQECVNKVAQSGQPYDLEDDEDDQYMDYNTQMFAEYEGILNGRNILENRPNGNASERKVIGSFIPGSFNQRGIHQFEEQIKGKLRDDKKVYKGGVPPPVRLMLDSNCKIQSGQEDSVKKSQSINQNDPVLVHNVANKEILMGQQQQQQQPAQQQQMIAQPNQGYGMVQPQQQQMPQYPMQQQPQQYYQQNYGAPGQMHMNPAPPQQYGYYAPPINQGPPPGVMNQGPPPPGPYYGQMGPPPHQNNAYQMAVPPYKYPPNMIVPQPYIQPQNMNPNHQ